ncbi:hypothetical protein BALH_1863 [Bacillus thuringiensis str. Al Hakam]|nr:hypothetical protein BALH_1863 [Bacillus thuringiensis str. Al Hakam]
MITITIAVIITALAIFIILCLLFRLLKLYKSTPLSFTISPTENFFIYPLLSFASLIKFIKYVNPIANPPKTSTKKKVSIRSPTDCGKNNESNAIIGTVIKYIVLIRLKGRIYLLLFLLNFSIRFITNVFHTKENPVNIRTASEITILSFHVSPFTIANVMNNTAVAHITICVTLRIFPLLTHLNHQTFLLLSLKFLFLVPPTQSQLPSIPFLYSFHEIHPFPKTQLVPLPPSLFLYLPRIHILLRPQ